MYPAFLSTPRNPGLSTIGCEELREIALTEGTRGFNPCTVLIGQKGYQGLVTTFGIEDDRKRRSWTWLEFESPREISLRDRYATVLTVGAQLRDRALDEA
jgi:hypothetical protein